jgi:transposase
LSQTVERRLAAIEACERRGESLKGYAERTGQSVAVFYEAKRAARRAGVLPPPPGAKPRARDRDAHPATGRFVEAVAARSAGVATSTTGGVAWRLRLPGGVLLESTTELDAASLSQLVAALGGRS